MAVVELMGFFLLYSCFNRQHCFNLTLCFVRHNCISLIYFIWASLRLFAGTLLLFGCKLSSLDVDEDKHLCAINLIVHWSGNTKPKTASSSSAFVRRAVQLIHFSGYYLAATAWLWCEWSKVFHRPHHTFVFICRMNVFERAGNETPQQLHHEDCFQLQQHNIATNCSKVLVA